MNMQETSIIQLEDEVSALKAQLERQKILVKILQIMQSTKDFSKAINEMITEIGIFAELSRVCVCKKNNNGGFSCINEWNNTGIKSMSEDFENSPVEILQSFFDAFDAGEIINPSDISTLDSHILEKCKLFGVKSLLVLPLTENNKHYGFVAFDDCEHKRSWSDDEVELLKSLSQVISEINHRHKVEQELNKERDRLQSIGDNFPGGSLFRWEVDCITKDMHFTYLSKTWTEITGLEIQKSLEDFPYILSFVLPEDAEILMDEINGYNKDIQIPESKESSSIEIRFSHPSGEIRWFQILSHPHLITKKKLIYDGFILDITTRKLAEQELHLEHDRLCAIGDNFPDGSLFRFEINTQTGKRRFVYMSRTWEKVTGISIEKSLEDASNVFALIHPDYLTRFREEKDKSIVELKHYFLEIQFYKGDEIRWLLLSSHPQKIADDIVVYDGFILDITARKETEIELIYAKEKAEESDKLKSAFLANVSHEIRTPLHAIVGFLKIITTEKMSRKHQQKLFQIINNSAKQLTRLIDNIVVVSKIESKQLKILPVSTDLNQLMKEQLITFEKRLKNLKKTDMTLILDDSGFIDNCIINVDSVRLQQVLNNLIDNAIKFTEKGYVRVGYHQLAPDKLEFVVEDTGIGIDLNNYEKIFERFSKIGYHLYDGVGLGLNISRSLVQMMGGDIWVESTKGEGSKFYFTILNLPVKLNNMR